MRILKYTTMQHYFWLSFLLFSSMLLNSVAAQSCEPDEMYADSTAGVYPAPITVENPDGGIDQPACIGEYYEYTLTVIIPDSIEVDLFGTTLDLEIISADVATENAIEGLPEGIDYLCVPADCRMPALTSGCLLLYGTVPPGTPPGNYELSLSLNITFTGLGRQNFSFPGTVFPGEYYLTVLPEEDGFCTTSNPRRPEQTKDSRIFPNPMNSGAAIQFDQNETWNQLNIYQLSGQKVATITHSNRQSFSPQLPAGVYIAVFYGDSGIHREKIVVH